MNVDFLTNSKDTDVQLIICSAGNTWKWGTGQSEYRNWASQESRSNGDCVSISSVQKEMATQNCSARFPFICIRDNLVLVKENKTWEEALHHCRTLKFSHQPGVHYELVSVKPGEDHDYVMNKVKEANSEKVGSSSVAHVRNDLFFHRCYELSCDITRHLHQPIRREIQLWKDGQNKLSLNLQVVSRIPLNFLPSSVCSRSFTTPVESTVMWHYTCHEWCRMKMIDWILIYRII